MSVKSLKQELYKMYELAREAQQEAHMAEQKFKQFADRLKELYDGI